MKLLDQLERYSQSDAYPLHMPGHKRQSQLLDPRLPWHLDITEIDGFDNLHDPQGILLEAKEQATRLYHTEESFFLINGSTGGILSAIYAATAPGDRVLMTRNCHKSVYHALELRDLTPVYLSPRWDGDYGVFGSVDPQDVEAALQENPSVKLVILTSPTYEGVVSDISAIAAIVHRYHIPLMVDEAHGAHLRFDSHFPRSAVDCGADVVIQSLHKTLPSLTQTAIAHRCSQRIDPLRLSRALAMFQTSSPSYLLMASIENCMELMEKPQPLFDRWRELLHRFSERILPLKHLRVLCHGGDTIQKHPTFFAFDPSKIVISTKGCLLTEDLAAGGKLLLKKGDPLTGPALSELLRSRYALELEMAMGDYALAMTSPCDSEEGLARLADALLEIDGLLLSGPRSEDGFTIIVPPYRAAPAAVPFLPRKPLSFEDCVGKISAETVWAYPPGIPLLVPGEEITGELMDNFHKIQGLGVQLHSDRGELPKTLWVVA